MVWKYFKPVLKECTLSDFYCVSVNVVLNFAFSFILIRLCGKILIIVIWANNVLCWEHERLAVDLRVLTLVAAEFEIVLGNLQWILLMKIIITWKK